MDIVKKLDMSVNFGPNQFKVGQSEWAAITFNVEHRWVFPLVPTARAYTKLDEYFGKFRNAEIQVLQAQGGVWRKFTFSESSTAAATGNAK